MGYALLTVPAPSLRSQIAPFVRTDAPGLQRLPSEACEHLWDTWILGGRGDPRVERHGMRLDAHAWPSTRGAVVPLPLSARWCTPSWWVFFWMRERAAVVTGAHLARHLDDLLDEDDEAVIGINTDNLDSLQSWGGRRQWIEVQRPSLDPP